MIRYERKGKNEEELDAGDAGTYFEQLR